jgi:hypothetical protein
VCGKVEHRTTPIANSLLSGNDTLGRNFFGLKLTKHYTNEGIQINGLWVWLGV